MAAVKNVLFVMTDQLRADYLGAAGHPAIKTPNLDALAADGMMFANAYCNATICGSSRMCFYTGRYMSTHGATWNNVPLSVAEHTMGDYLRPLGVRTALVGKTHMTADLEGLERFGIDPADDRATLLRECGFEPFERDDGLHPDQADPRDLAYNRYLRGLGYDGDNPWHGWANSAAGPNGEILSGWYMRNAHLPARVAEEHSETAYMTDRAIAFLDQAGDQPWCLHLSYIKPHWPYMAPAPYHDMYGADAVMAANRDEAERADPHPVYAAFMGHRDSQAFSRDETRRRVIPTYMGLTSQIDAHLGRLFDDLKRRGLWDNTLIVFTSDHGDYLGDHWLGEKELFHEESVRIPMIVRDPDAAADVTRGRVSTAFVEAIDLLPTFVEALGGAVAGQRLEGRSLLPILRPDDSAGAGADGAPADWRDMVVAETDYAPRPGRLDLGIGPERAKGIMVRTRDWKYVYYPGFRPQLFDLTEDPRELVDLGDSEQAGPVIAEMKDRLVEFLTLRRTRTTISDETLDRRTGSGPKRGYLIGYW